MCSRLIARLSTPLRTPITYVAFAFLLLVSASAAAVPKGKTAPVQLDAASERVALAVLGSYQTGVSKDEVRAAAKTLIAVSHEEGVDPFLVLGVIRVESSGWSHARSDVGARGLMQVMPFVAKAMAKETGAKWGGAETLHDPQVNLRLGIHYLATLVEKYDGEASKALSAYSMGPTKLDSILRRGKEPVNDYPISVQWFADRYRALAAEHGDLEPGFSRFEIALRLLEKNIGGKPSTAYALATGKKEKVGWNKRTKKPAPAQPAIDHPIAALVASASP